MDSFELRVFISYSHIDEQKCLEIAQLLKGFDVWFDTKSLYGGDVWWQTITERIIEWSDVFLYLISPASVISKHCVREYEIADGLEIPKSILPVYLEPPKSINLPPRIKQIESLQWVDYTDSNDFRIRDLLISLFNIERKISKSRTPIESLDKSKLLPPDELDSLELDDDNDTPYNFVMRFERQYDNPHTRRASYRWIDKYLVDMGGLEPIYESNRDLYEARRKRLKAIPLNTAKKCLAASQLLGWFGLLDTEEIENFVTPRRAILSFAEMLCSYKIIDKRTLEDLKAVATPKPLKTNFKPKHEITFEMLLNLILASKKVAPTRIAGLRNYLAVTMLCSMGFRRGELADLRWHSVDLRKKKLEIERSENIVSIPIPNVVEDALTKWAYYLDPMGESPDPQSHLLRRVFKGGALGGGISADGIALIVRDAAKKAKLKQITAESLRNDKIANIHAGLNWPYYDEI